MYIPGYGTLTELLENWWKVYTNGGRHINWCLSISLFSLLLAPINDMSQLLKNMLIIVNIDEQWLEIGSGNRQNADPLLIFQTRKSEKVVGKIVKIDVKRNDAVGERSLSVREAEGQYPRTWYVICDTSVPETIGYYWEERW